MKRSKSVWAMRLGTRRFDGLRGGVERMRTRSPKKGMSSNKLGQSDAARASFGAWSAPTVALEEAVPLASKKGDRTPALSFAEVQGDDVHVCVGRSVQSWQSQERGPSSAAGEIWQSFDAPSRRRCRSWTAAPASRMWRSFVGGTRLRVPDVIAMTFATTCSRLAANGIWRTTASMPNPTRAWIVWRGS